MDQHNHDHDTGRSGGIAHAASVGGGRVSDSGTGGPDRQSPQTRGPRKGWREQEVNGVLTVSRHLPVSFDLAVETVLPAVGSRRRLAHQVRQDMWRALRDLRGFAPAVRVASEAGHLRLTAGGSVAAKTFPRARCEAVLRSLLEDPRARARWLRCAGGQNA